MPAFAGPQAVLLPSVGVDDDQVLADVTARRVDPTAGRDRLVAELRRAGFAGTVAEAHELVRRYRATPGVGPLELDPTRTMGRLEVAVRLRRSVQRVDQLRRLGELDWATRADGSVAITRESVERRLASGSHGSRLPLPRRRTEQRA